MVISLVRSSKMPLDLLVPSERVRANTRKYAPTSHLVFGLESDSRWNVLAAPSVPHVLAALSNVNAAYGTSGRITQ